MLQKGGVIRFDFVVFITAGVFLIGLNGQNNSTQNTNVSSTIIQALAETSTTLNITLTTVSSTSSIKTKVQNTTDASNSTAVKEQLSVGPDTTSTDSPETSNNGISSTSVPLNTTDSVGNSNLTFSTQLPVTPSVLVPKNTTVTVLTTRRTKVKSNNTSTRNDPSFTSIQQSTNSTILTTTTSTAVLGTTSSTGLSTTSNAEPARTSDPIRHSIRNSSPLLSVSKSSPTSSTEAESARSSMTPVPINPTISTHMNTTQVANTTHVPDKDSEFSPELALGIVLVAVTVIAISGFILLHLKRRRKKSYRPLTLPRCLACFKFKRVRSPSIGSQGPLTLGETTSVDIPTTNRDSELFSIGDQDGGSNIRSSFSRQEADDDYFYDEIFERSAFEDSNTMRSNKQFTLSRDNEFDDDDFDDELEIPDLEFKRPNSRI